ncbi:thioesterase family protein [Aquimarina pacifica]|uniref:thioesterase family protein n=1 Tax=Aquimarina pacifica TaxID=1296415 RepID=UPI0004712302|nr:thioesterase family protein [Aquimarina pacifica]
MIYRKAYKVTGDDVNDFMVMQRFAYLSYTSRAFENFLFSKGLSKQKMQRLQLGLQGVKEEIIYQKNLMFTQSFFVNLECFAPTSDTKKLAIKSRFFNIENQLCAIVHTDLYWYHHSKQAIIQPPKKIAKNFLC